MRVRTQGNSSSYLSAPARARKAPEVLARYEAGQLPPEEHVLTTEKMKFPATLSETHEAAETFH